MMKPSCLIVDDEPHISELIAISLEKMGIKTDCAASVEDAKYFLRKQRYDLCLTDMRLPDGNGLDLVKHIGMQYTGLPTAVITAYGNSDNAVSALKAGAFDYLSKPISLNELRPLVANAIRSSQNNIDKNENIALVGESKKLDKVRTIISQLSANQSPVMITGEIGTGKESAAKLIHLNSTRREGNFIKVNCATITERNADISFLGDEALSENSNKKRKIGFLNASNGGTIFLDNLDKLPLNIQRKLHDFIQQNNSLDIRFISASNQNITQLVKQGLFNQDLYYLLHVVHLPMPSLDAIRKDIGMIAQHLLNKVTWFEAAPRMLSECAINKLQSHHYEGNVRELKNIIERAVALNRFQIITAEHLLIKETNNYDADNKLDASSMTLPEYLEEIEKQTILKALNKTHQNKTAAAKLLGVSFRTLRYRLSKLRLGKKLD